MLNDFTGADKVYIACGYTDLRKGIDGLARLEQEKPVLDALLSWANEMQGKTAPKSALGRAIGSAPFLDFASKAYRKKARKAIHQV